MDYCDEEIDCTALAFLHRASRATLRRFSLLVYCVTSTCRSLESPFDAALKRPLTSRSHKCDDDSEDDLFEDIFLHNLSSYRLRINSATRPTSKGYDRLVISLAYRLARGLWRDSGECLTPPAGVGAPRLIFLCGTSGLIARLTNHGRSFRAGVIKDLHGVQASSENTQGEYPDLFDIATYTETEDSVGAKCVCVCGACGFFAVSTDVGLTFSAVSNLSELCRNVTIPTERRRLAEILALKIKNEEKIREDTISNQTPDFLGCRFIIGGELNETGANSIFRVVIRTCRAILMITFAVRCGDLNGSIQKDCNKPVDGSISALQAKQNAKVKENIQTVSFLNIKLLFDCDTLKRAPTPHISPNATTIYMMEVFTLHATGTTENTASSAIFVSVEGCLYIIFGAETDSVKLQTLVVQHKLGIIRALVPLPNIIDSREKLTSEIDDAKRRVQGVQWQPGSGSTPVEESSRPAKYSYTTILPNFCSEEWHDTALISRMWQFKEENVEIKESRDQNHCHLTATSCFLALANNGPIVDYDLTCFLYIGEAFLDVSPMPRQRFGFSAVLNINTMPLLRSGGNNPDVGLGWIICPKKGSAYCDLVLIRCNNLGLCTQTLTPNPLICSQCSDKSGTDCACAFSQMTVSQWSESQPTGVGRLLCTTEGMRSIHKCSGHSRFALVGGVGKGFSNFALTYGPSRSCIASDSGFRDDGDRDAEVWNLPSSMPGKTIYAAASIL